MASKQEFIQSEKVIHSLKKWAFPVIATLLVCGILMFGYQNLASEKVYKDLGEKIAAIAKEDEVIFIDSDREYILSYIFFYARRNMALWSDEKNALALILTIAPKRGIVFRFNRSLTEIESIQYIQPE